MHVSAHGISAQSSAHENFFQKKYSRGKSSKHYTSRVLYILQASYKIIVFIIFIIKVVILFTIFLRISNKSITFAANLTK